MLNYLSHLILLLKRLGIAFLIFTISRLLFYIFNLNQFIDIPFELFVYGIRFDIVAISYLFSPFIVLSLIPIPYRNLDRYQFVLKILFHISNTIGLLFNLIDVAYFSFTLKRATADLFKFISTGNDTLRLLPQFIIDYWYILALLVVLIALSEWLFRITNKKLFYNSLTLKGYIIHSLIFISFCVVTIFGFRGGTQLKPINITDAGNYASAKNIPVVINTPFSLIKTILEESISLVDYYNENELKSIYSPEQKIISSGSFKGKNVVILILESFSKEYVGSLNNNIGYTPFLDSLIDYSYVFNNARASGTRSIDALPTIFTGIPTLMNTPYIISNYSTNETNSLSKELNKHGYNSSFYHGGENGTMGFEGFTNLIGMEYFGLSEYPNSAKDYDGNWGIFDEPYLQYFCNELDNKKEPFLSSIFTLSSHHPYSIPSQYKGKFPKGNLAIHETIGYTDYAVQQFFNSAKTKKWFNNTLFIITADHSAQVENDKFKIGFEKYSIPIIFYDPTGNLKGVHSNLAQQLDITPSVLHLVSEEENIVSFGHNLFDKTADNYIVKYESGSYQILSEKYCLQFNGKETTNIYKISSDSLTQNNQLNLLKEPELIKLENTLKAHIQQYNNRLIKNILLPKQ